MRRYKGVRIENNKLVPIICIVTGQMGDGTLVYTECVYYTSELKNTDIQYIRTTREGLQLFIEL